MNNAFEPLTSETKNAYRDSGRILVSRLIGMETEYATMVVNRPELASDQLPSARAIYERLTAAIRSDQPTVSGIYDRDQIFLASGGAVTFESHPTLQSLPGGLIEIATPEVNSPDELLACQRSIDQLVSEAAIDEHDDVDLRILKNSSDALGHVYGCQENFESEVASGVWLWIYWCFVSLLWGMQILSLVVTFPLFTVVHLFGMWRHNRQATARDAEAVEPSDCYESLPRWSKFLLLQSLRLVYLPTVITLRTLARHVAFRKQRRYLTAMLVSRITICGTGDLDHQGRYRISAKAMAIDQLSDLGSYNGERPIFVFGHWLEQFCARSYLSIASTRTMYRRKQRLQIGLSDSNLSELAEYVKVGSVSLILDMIECGETRGLLTLSDPIASLHEIASDWNLVRRVRTSRGKLSALEIQHAYLSAARQFVERTAPDKRGEAELVVQRWTELLNVVKAFRREAKNLTPALGRIDWLSKRWLIDQLGSDATWVVRKKTDLRYHELSPDGYYQKLVASNPMLNLIHSDRIEQRRRTPPAGSPATKRGWLIREFADSEEPVSAEWSYALLGEGKNRKRIDFVIDPPSPSPAQSADRRKVT